MPLRRQHHVHDALEFNLDALGADPRGGQRLPKRSIMRGSVEVAGRVDLNDHRVHVRLRQLSNTFFA